MAPERPRPCAPRSTSAGLAPERIGFLKLHGTATPANDSAEMAAASAVFPQPVPAGVA